MNMSTIFLLSCLVLTEVEMFNQNEYRLVLEYVESPGYNKKTFDYMYAKSVKLNRTYKAMEFGFRSKHQLSEDRFKVNRQALQFFHNEYRRTPILFDVKVCVVLEMNTFGVGVLLSENGNITKCPLRKRTYVIHRFNFDSTKFPPNIPRGRWQLKLRSMERDTEAARANVYITVEEYPFSSCFAHECNA